MNYYKLADTVRACFGTANALGSINADTLPTAVVLEQGSALAYAPVVTNKTTGLYEVTVVCSTANGFEAGKEYTVYVTATVGGVTGRDGLMAFSITATNVDDVPTVGEIDTELTTQHGAGVWNAAGPPSAGTIAATVWAYILESPYSAAEIIRLLTSNLVGDGVDLDGPTPSFLSLDGTKTRVSGVTDEDSRVVTVGDLTD